MTAAPLLILYCLLILLASLAGGLIPLLVRLTHRRMEIALSFVSGVMLGVALVHLLPGSLAEFAATDSAAQTGQDAGAHAGHVGHAAVSPAMLWLLAGFLVMFFVERYFCFHHHDLPATSGERGAEGNQPARQRRDGKQVYYSLNSEFLTNGREGNDCLRLSYGHITLAFGCNGQTMPTGEPSRPSLN